MDITIFGQQFAVEMLKTGFSGVTVGFFKRNYAAKPTLRFSRVYKGAWLLLRTGLYNTMLIHGGSLHRGNHSAADLAVNTAYIMFYQNATQ